MITIAIANQKVGVGKTTTTVNLGAALAAQGKRVLLVDADPQGNLSTHLGFEKTSDHGTLTSLLRAVVEDESFPDAIQHHEEGMDFIPSNINLAGMEVRLNSEMAHECVMREVLAPYQDQYDYCLIDCMPSLGILTVSSLVASDRVLIPVEPKHFAIDGLIALFQSIRKARRRINPNLEIEGIVLTLVDRRTNLAKDVCADLRKSYGKALRIYKTEIPVNTRTAESVSSGHSVLTYDPNCAGSLAYQALAKEVLNHERTRTESAIAR